MTFLIPNFEFPTFVDSKAAEQFTCAICLETCKETVQIACEDHIFCKKCIMKEKATKGRSFRCPICRLRCTAKSIHRVQFIDRQINNLMVKCPNYQLSSEKTEYFKNNNKYKLQNKNNNNICNTNSNNKQRENEENEDIDLENTNNNKSNELRRSKRIKYKNKQKQKLQKTEKLSGQKRKKPDDAECLKNIKNNVKRMRIIDNNYNNNNNKENICDWIGSFGDLQNHINKCPLQLISCKYCNRSMLRRDLEIHYEECIHFIIRCKKCWTQIRRYQLSQHIKEHCPMTIIPCIQCRKNILRQNQSKHINSSCPETLVLCEFNKFGCRGSLKRGGVADHNRKFVHNHLRLVQESHSFLEKRVFNLNQQQNERIQELMNRINNLEQQNNVLQSIPNRVSNLEQQNQSLQSLLQWAYCWGYRQPPMQNNQYRPQ